VRVVRGDQGPDPNEAEIDNRQDQSAESGIGHSFPPGDWAEMVERVQELAAV